MTAAYLYGRWMTLSTKATWVDVLVAIVAAALAGAGGKSPGLAVIAFAVALTGAGVWRAVRFLGVLVELKQAEHSAEEPEAQGWS